MAYRLGSISIVCVMVSMFAASASFAAPPPAPTASEVAPPLSPEVVEGIVQKIVSEYSDKLGQKVEAAKSDAEKSNDALKNEVNEASLKKAVADVRLENAEAALANLKSGKLIKYGVTGGVAVSALLLFGLSDKLGIEQRLAFSAMPYVSIFPQYWGISEALRNYCADSYLSGSSTASTAVAQAAENMRSKYKLQGLVAGKRLGRWQAHTRKFWEDPASEEGNETKTYCAPEGVKTTLENPCKRYQVTENQVKQIAEANENDLKKLEEDGSDLRSSWLRDVTDDAWNPTLVGKCLRTRFGAFAGVTLPIDIDVSNRDNQLENSSGQKYTNMVSGGLIFAPNAYFSLLLGIGYGRVRPDNDSSRADVLSVNLGLGGNLDLFGFIAGGTK